MKSISYLIISTSILIILYSQSQAQIIFQDITSSSGLGNFMELGYGAAMLDYDNDGLQDIFVVGQAQHNRLFRNTGSMQFEDVTGLLGIRGSGLGWGVCFGDFDSDYDEDIYISRRDGATNDLFVNNNDMFVESSNYYGVQDLGGYGYSACFAPLTKSLTLDLIVANQAWSGRAQSCRFFHNNLGQPFINLTQSSGLADSSQYWDVPTAVDFDNNGVLELFITGESLNRLYRNNGHGGLVNISDSARINIPFDSDTCGYGISWGDYNNDGWLDYYVSNWHDQYGELFRNNGDGSFTEVNIGTGQEVWCHSVSFADFDNDGWPDLYTVTGDYGNQLYKNNSGISFTEIGQNAGVRDDNRFCCGLAVGDIDNDGRLDMVIGHYAGDNVRKVTLYHNITHNNNHWVEIKVNGFPPNPDAIGARVRIVAGGISQIREVSGGSGFGSQNMLPLHFGLGEAAVMDSVIITYPMRPIAPIVYTGLSGDYRYTLPEIDIDVASLRFLNPNQDVWDCEQPLMPSVLITNLGNVDVSNLRVKCDMIAANDTTLIDTMVVPILTAGDTITLDFNSIDIPVYQYDYFLRVFTRALGDRARHNDTVITSFYAGYSHDLSCGPAIRPGVDSLTYPILPEVMVINRGISEEIGFPVNCFIYSNDSLYYSAVVQSTNILESRHSTTVDFPVFNPRHGGNYRAVFITALDGDRNVSNDTALVNFYIEGNDCHYIVGDVNNSGVTNGVDINYAVLYFKGGPTPPYSCHCPGHDMIFAAGDVNGSCSFNGTDISYMVNFFKGGELLRACPDCQPLTLIQKSK
jgi:enediyne biosynthesis protein E4